MLMLLLCNVFTLSAAEELYAQHYNVTLSLRNATVKEAVDAVTRQTGIAFSYESSVGVMPLGNVEIRVDGGAVDAVLGPLFADKGIAWQVVDGVVILTRQNSPPQSDSGRRLTVRGRITAGAGESIVGATVMVKGTQTGVSSDVEGNYEIVVPGPGSVLVFNYLGYQPQEIAVGNRTQIDVRLAEDNNVLDDVVVIGYGTQSRRTLTSAVSKVSGADLEGVPVNSIGDALKGKVPGVRVSTANNQPGSDPVFLIRGGSSINQSNAPIIIVDGVRREMTGLNTNDIESIDILKDAASAAIYGASVGSSGVILITTRQAQAGKARVNVNVSVGFERSMNLPTMLNAQQFCDVWGKAVENSPGSSLPNLANPQVYAGANVTRTDWLDEIFRTGLTQHYAVSITGGSETLSSILSVTYDKKEGTLLNTWSQALGAKLHTEFKPVKWLKLSERVNFECSNGQGLAHGPHLRRHVVPRFRIGL